MPLTRNQVRNEYGLADPELYQAADKDDPEALLEGVAMAGLVGVLRQLGDLSEFAAEVFHDLHEEVIATAARGHGLMVRVQQLEAEFPSIEKAILLQTDHSSFFSNSGVDWHPSMRIEQNLITCGDLPRCVMDSYEECRGPPRLFLLDKFDVVGAGACLKRYTDPSFFKIETSTLEVQREKKSQKMKKKGSRWRNEEKPDFAPASHAKLHQLFLQEGVESDYTDPACLVKLKRRQLNGSPLNSNSGRSYMERFLQTPSPEHQTVPGVSSNPQLLTLSTVNSSESGDEILEISDLRAVERTCQGKETEASVCNMKEVAPTLSMDYLNSQVIDRDVETLPEPTDDYERVEIPSSLHKITVEKKVFTDGKGRRGNCLDVNNSGDLTLQVDNNIDALVSVESETESDSEYKPQNELGHLKVGKHGTDSDANVERMDILSQSSDTQSIGHTYVLDDRYCSIKEGKSSFAYSDTLSTYFENEQSDVEESVKLSPSAETCVPETEDALFNQLPVNKDSGRIHSYELVSVSDNNGSIPKLDEASFSSSSTMNLSSLPLDPETSLQIGPEKLSTDEIGMNMFDSSAVSIVHSEARDDTVMKVPAQAHNENHSVSGDSKVSSNLPVKEVLQADYEDNNTSENFVNAVSGFVQSFSPEVDTPVSSAEIKSEEVESDNTLSTRDVRKASSEHLSPVDSVADDTVAKRDEGNLEDRTSMGTIEADESVLPLEISSENRRPMPDTSHDDPSAEHDMAPASLYTEQKEHVKQRTMVADDSVEMGLFCDDIEVEGDTDPLKCPSNYLDDPAHGNQTGFHNIATETINEGDSFKFYVDDVVHAPSDSISSPLKSLICVQESLSVSDNQHGEWLETLGTPSLGNHLGSEDQRRENPLEVASANLDSAPSKSVTNDNFVQEESDDLQYSSSYEPRIGSLTVSNIAIVPRFPKSSHLESEPISPSQSNLLESNEETVPSATCFLQENKTEQLPDLQAHQDEHLPTHEATSKPLIYQFEHLQCLDYTDQETHLKVSSESFLPSLGLFHEATQTVLEEMPPPPPLPPMQWRICKCQDAAADTDTQTESVETTTILSPTMSSISAVSDGELNLTASDKESTLTGNPILPWTSVEEGENEHNHPPESISNLVQHSPLLSQSPTTITDANSRQSSERLEHVFLPTEANISVSTSTLSIPIPDSEHVTLNRSEPDMGFEGEALLYISRKSIEGENLPGGSVLQSEKVEELPQLVDHCSDEQTAQPSESSSVQNALSSSTGDKKWPVNAFALAPTFEVEKPNENPTLVKLPRPRSPLVDAVVALDRSMLRKVSERVRPPVELMVDEKDSLLEQIRNKSFNLKPALVTRPGIQVGPKTNFKVAAILEKANTIRQAMAGTDEDDDSDSWSDS